MIVEAAISSYDNCGRPKRQLRTDPTHGRNSQLNQQCRIRLSHLWATIYQSTEFLKKTSFASIRNAFKSTKDSETPPVPSFDTSEPFERASFHCVTDVTQAYSNLIQ